ncbi:MAG: TetR/AcrR family transcriptional regulator [Sciscionella sp.]
MDSADDDGVAGTGTPQESETPARERILAAAEELFAESGFDATPTSRIAGAAGVPKGLVHYYFRRKFDLLAALADRLPVDRVDHDEVVVPGDVAASLCRLVAELDARQEESPLLSHLLWREADTHDAVRDALGDRYRNLVSETRAVILAASGEEDLGDVASAAELFALAVSYRHSVARHRPDPAERPADDQMAREVAFIAHALALGAGGQAEPG